jgi:transposase
VAWARFRDPRCASSEEEIARALTGHYLPEHLFTLKQALALFDFYTQEIRECDAEIERQFQALKPATAADLPALKAPTKRSSGKNQPSYDARTLLYHVMGIDLVAITGLNTGTLQTIVSETGTDLSSFPSEKQFCSWLSLAPIMTSRVARSCGVARSGATTEPGRLFGWPPKRSVEATTLWERTTAG